MYHIGTGKGECKVKLNIEEIKWLMIEQGFSLTKLAKKSYVSKATISRMLNDISEPRPDTIGKIAKVLGVNPRTLYYLDKK